MEARVQPEKVSPTTSPHLAASVVNLIKKRAKGGVVLLDLGKG
jgi:hypothetical protein